MAGKTLNKIKRQTARVIVRNRMRKRQAISSETDKKRRKRLSGFLLITAFALLVVPGIVCLRHQILNERMSQNEISENQELFSLANVIYRHYKGYESYCGRQGVMLKNYPKAFYDAYNKELLIFGHQVRAHGFTPDKILTKIEKEFASISEISIQREFNRLIQNRFQKKDGGPVQTEADLCRFIEANPAVWMNEHEETLKSIREFAKNHSK